MNLVFFGDPRAANDLLQAALSRGDRLLAWSDGGAGGRGAPAPLLQLGRRVDDLEGLLALADVDALLLFSHDASLDQHLRRAAQAGTAVLYAFPATTALPAYYEAELIRESTRAVLVPCLPDRWHPGFERLRQLLEARTFGEPSLVRLEWRFTADTEAAAAAADPPAP